VDPAVDVPNTSDPDGLSQIFGHLVQVVGTDVAPQYPALHLHEDIGLTALFIL
jgi:hypothetical protein